jgi:hypothetical protein
MEWRWMGVKKTVERLCAHLHSFRSLLLIVRMEDALVDTLGLACVHRRGSGCG